MSEETEGVGGGMYFQKSLRSTKIYCVEMDNAKIRKFMLQT